MATERTNNPPESGVGRISGDPAPSGTHGMAGRMDTPVGDRQAVEGREDDDLGAATEEEAFVRAARSTPSAADVRSDDQGVWNGEPR